MKRKTIAGIFVVGFMAGLAGVSLTGCQGGSDAGKGHGAAAKKDIYHCPMHPTYVADRKGECPICYMDLVIVEDDPAPPDHAPARFHCPMHPAVVSDDPGRCHICGMDLVPIAEEHTDHATHASPAAAVPGQAPVQLTVEREQLIGVRTAPAEEVDLIRRIRLPGVVARDPELHAALVEYRQAKDTVRAGSGAPWPDIRDTARTLRDAALARLAQHGVDASEAERILNSETALKALLYPQSGADAWVYAQIFPSDVTLVRPGRRVEATTAALPGRSIPGTVRSVDLIVDPVTRTLRARIEVENRGVWLKPEMYVDVTFAAPLGRKLAVPQDAILDTGTRQLLFVRTRPGRYEPRAVRTGLAADGYVEVLSGVSAGEEIVVSGNFLIDSESKIRSAIGAPAAHQH